MFEVKLDKGHLQIRYSRPKTRSMPEIPTVIYIICTPRTAMNVSATRAEMYKFIRVCDKTLLERLVSSPLPAIYSIDEVPLSLFHNVSWSNKLLDVACDV